jgi:NADP-dependent aldehyde dehydrogenase
MDQVKRKNLMPLSGEMLIGASRVRGGQDAFRGVNATTGEELDPLYGGAGGAELERACALAWSAFDAYRETSLDQRARLLETIARGIDNLGDELVQRASVETGLPKARIEGERARTSGQLRLFAGLVREGSWLDARIDPAIPDRKPMPRSDLRLRNIAVGPVAVFGASNFPLAFSVAGGDTASALAAGCPVVVKAHPSHPGTSELVGQVVQAAVAECELPEGVFSLLFGLGNWLGSALVADPRIMAVGFTGSRQGGMSLMRIAAERPQPIPVYAEMSSINPVVLMPAALGARGSQLGKGFVTSLTMGVGQFCTNPGLILAMAGPGLAEFISSAAEAIAATPASTMLHKGICETYKNKVRRMETHPNVKCLARGPAGANLAEAALFTTDVESFKADETLRDEIFGPSSLLVRCPDLQSIRYLLEDLEGQLTITIQMDDADQDGVRALLPTLERKAGRVLANGWPTGVEVGHAMVHGGPFPATSDGRTTSVGTLAIRRFLRPVCYQDIPTALLPQTLRDQGSEKITRLINGQHIEKVD